MAEKTTLPQVNYVSDNPEQDWKHFEGVMRHILTTPKPGENQAGMEPEDIKNSPKTRGDNTPCDRT